MYLSKSLDCFGFGEREIACGGLKKFSMTQKVR